MFDYLSNQEFLVCVMIKIKKGLILISFLLILSISLGAVSAADMSVNDISSVDNAQNMEIVQEDSSQKKC